MDVLQMEYAQAWNPGRLAALCTSQNAESSQPPSADTRLDGSLCWPHNQFRNIGLLGRDPPSGCTSGQVTPADSAGCVRNAVLIALRSAHPPDIAAQESTRLWESWVRWGALPNLVAQLRPAPDASYAGNTYTLVRVGPAKLPLLLTPLGREMLHKFGVRCVLINPVAEVTGWTQHALTMTADDMGVWALHDPADMTNTSDDVAVELWGRIPNVAQVAHAYIFNVKPLWTQ